MIPENKIRWGALCIAAMVAAFLSIPRWYGSAQLPAGVPGAFRLFQNLLSVGDYEPSKSNPMNVVSEEERPPIFKSWRRLYLIVLGNLILLIGLFYIVTRIFS